MIKTVIIGEGVTRIERNAFSFSRINNVYVTVPKGKTLKVTIDGAKKSEVIKPNYNGMANISDWLLVDYVGKYGWMSSRALTLEIVDPSTVVDEPSTQKSKGQAKSTMTVNFENNKENGATGSGDVSGGKTKVTVGAGHLAGSETRRNAYADSRAAFAEEQENDEIEIVSGQEYELLHDGYIVLNFYTPDAAITVNSVIIRRPGDANNDGYVDAADLVEMINAKAGKASERFNLTNADIDRNGEITQDDIDFVVKLIME